MKIKQFLEKAPADQREHYENNFDIWSNGDCKGLCIKAMQNAGLSLYEIISVMIEMQSLLDSENLSNTNRYYFDFKRALADKGKNGLSYEQALNYAKMF